MMDFFQNNDNTGVCSTTRTFFQRMRRKSWTKRPDEKKENDKSDNLGQHEAMALSG